MPPCFDNVSLLLTDNGGNILAYVLQRYPAAVENTPNVNYGDTYREIFLDPDAGTLPARISTRTSRRSGRSIRRDPRSGPSSSAWTSMAWRLSTTSSSIRGPPPEARPCIGSGRPCCSRISIRSSEAERQLLVTVYPHIWTYEGIGYSRAAQ